MIEVSKGYASMGGTFKLTFKGHSTDTISYNAGAADIQAWVVRRHRRCRFRRLESARSVSPLHRSMYSGMDVLR